MRYKMIHTSEMYDCIWRLDWLHKGFTNLEVARQTVEGLRPICEIGL